MGTEIEGEWSDVMNTVQKAIQTLTDKGIRAYVSLNADIRPGHTNTIETKLQKLSHKLEG